MRYLIIFEQLDEDTPREALVSTGNERVIAECVDVIVRRLGARAGWVRSLRTAPGRDNDRGGP